MHRGDPRRELAANGLATLARLCLGVPVDLHEVDRVGEIGLGRRADRVQVLPDRGLGFLDLPGKMKFGEGLDERIPHYQPRPQRLAKIGHQQLDGLRLGPKRSRKVVFHLVHHPPIGAQLVQRLVGECLAEADAVGGPQVPGVAALPNEAEGGTVDCDAVVLTDPEPGIALVEILAHAAHAFWTSACGVSRSWRAGTRCPSRTRRRTAR